MQQNNADLDFSQSMSRLHDPQDMTMLSMHFMMSSFITNQRSTGTNYTDEQPPPPKCNHFS